MATHQANPTPSEFMWRRLHSLMGVMLVLFLIEHLLTNSEAALAFGEDGQGFVRMVNFIHSLPYLKVIEVALIGIPVLVHAIWGIKYLWTGEANSMPGSGKKPSLPGYARNHLYTFQRLTSWILLIGVVAHIGHMRIANYPTETHWQGENRYLVRLSLDDGLYTVAHRLGVGLFNEETIALEASTLKALEVEDSESSSKGERLIAAQEREQAAAWIKALQSQELEEGEVIAATSSMGTAFLLVVRDTFKMPAMMILYSIFVLAACYHAFNGLWTFLVTWGITVTERSQQLARYLCVGLMGALTFLGLVSIWGTYWINLYQ